MHSIAQRTLGKQEEEKKVKSKLTSKLLHDISLWRVNSFSCYCKCERRVVVFVTRSPGQWFVWRRNFFSLYHFAESELICIVCYYWVHRMQAARKREADSLWFSDAHDDEESFEREVNITVASVMRRERGRIIIHTARMHERERREENKKCWPGLVVIKLSVLSWFAYRGEAVKTCDSEAW